MEQVRTKSSSWRSCWLIEDKVKTSHYKMARVLEVYPGKDGNVKSALIKTVYRTFKRPVVKLAPLKLKTGPVLLAPQIMLRKIEEKIGRPS